MGSFRGAHGERVEREPITGIWGRARSGVQGQSPWLGSQGEALPPLKLKAFQLSGVQRTGQICTICSIFSSPLQ